MIDFIALELIEFHDIPIRRISIESRPSHKLMVECFLFDEGLNDYKVLRLIFDQLNSITPEKLSISDFSNFEINSFDYYLKGELFFGNMICITEAGKPSLNLEFSCRSVEVVE